MYIILIFTAVSRLLCFIQKGGLVEIKACLKCVFLALAIEFWLALTYFCVPYKIEEHNVLLIIQWLNNFFDVKWWSQFLLDCVTTRAWTNKIRAYRHYSISLSNIPCIHRGFHHVQDTFQESKKCLSSLR